MNRYLIETVYNLWIDDYPSNNYYLIYFTN